MLAACVAVPTCARTVLPWTVTPPPTPSVDCRRAPSVSTVLTPAAGNAASAASFGAVSGQRTPDCGVTPRIRLIVVAPVVASPSSAASVLSPARIEVSALRSASANGMVTTQRVPTSERSEASHVFAASTPVPAVVPVSVWTW